MSRVLVAEISGKRPGGKASRPTEYMDIPFDKVIVSNNSDGYETDWDVVMVPDEYRDWYRSDVATSENAWYAPMNRSYAIRFARENGYTHLVQLDDNITNFQIGYRFDDDDIRSRQYRYTCTSRTSGELPGDFIDMMVAVLEETNAGICGLNIMSAASLGKQFIAERYCYSFFSMDLSRVPDTYQGDFEDDIEFRLKMAQMGIPMLMLCPLYYGKTAQGKADEDLSGNRKAYAEAGVRRGENMSVLYGDVYRRGMSDRTKSCRNDSGELVRFRHKLAPFKVGAIVRDDQRIRHMMREMLRKYAREREDEVKRSEHEA